MRHTKIFALVLILLAPSVTVETVARTSTGQPRKDRAFEVECLTLVPPLPAGTQKLRVWIPVPQSGDHQRISNLKIQSPASYRIYQEPKFGDQYAYLELVPAKVATPSEIRVSFEATRQEYRADLTDPVASGAQPPCKANPESLAMWLQPDRLVPTNGMIGELSREHTQGLTQPLDKARAIYNYVVSTMAYDKSGQGWGRGDAVFACTARKGNCTDFHALFIGMEAPPEFPPSSRSGCRCPRTRPPARYLVTTAGHFSIWREPAGFPWTLPKRGRIRRGATTTSGRSTLTVCCLPKDATSGSARPRLATR